MSRILDWKTWSLEAVWSRVANKFHPECQPWWEAIQVQGEIAGILWWCLLGAHDGVWAKSQLLPLSSETTEALQRWPTLTSRTSPGLWPEGALPPQIFCLDFPFPHATQTLPLLMNSLSVYLSVAIREAELCPCCEEPWAGDAHTHMRTHTKTYSTSMRWGDVWVS